MQYLLSEQEYLTLTENFYDLQKDIKVAAQELVAKVVGNKCIHKAHTSDVPSFRYCDECPLGQIALDNYNLRNHFCDKTKEYNK